MALKKYWIVFNPVNDGKFQKYEVKQEAIDEASRQTKSTPVDILEVIARTRVPVPKIELDTVFDG